MTHTLEALADHTLVRVMGDLTIYEAPAIRDAVLQALQGAGAVVIDLDEVTDVDSAGLQVLISARRSASLLGTPLTLRCQSDPVVALMDLCGLRGVLLTSDGAAHSGA
jgi:anti-anti-sigma factor